MWLVNCKMSAAAVRGLSTAAAVAASMRSFPDGVWPTMITPFHSNKEKSIDWEGLDSKGSPMRIFLKKISMHVSIVLTEWYIKSGVAGIFSVCLSSEMFQVILVIMILR